MIYGRGHLINYRECTLKLLDTTLDGGLVEKISDWEPVAHPVLDATLDSRLMEGTTNPEPLEHSVLVGSLNSGLMEGMLSLEPLEQSVLNTLLVARPTEGITEMDPLERSALASQLDYGQSNLESPARLMLDITQDEITDTDADLVGSLDRAFGSGDALGIWTFEFGITVASDGGRCPGSSPHGGDNCSTSGRVFGPCDGPRQWTHGTFIWI